MEVRTLEGDWETGAVSDIGKEPDGSRPGEPGDPRAALVVALKNSGGRWVKVDGEDICQGGTHLRKGDEPRTREGSRNGGGALRRRRRAPNDGKGSGRPVQGACSRRDGEAVPLHGR